MLPLIAGGLALGGKLMSAHQEEEDARKRALQGLSQAYASGTYAPAADVPEGPSMLNLGAGAGLAAMDQGKANDAAAKSGNDPNDMEDGLRMFMRGRGM